MLSGAAAAMSAPCVSALPGSSACEPYDSHCAGGLPLPLRVHGWGLVMGRCCVAASPVCV